MNLYRLKACGKCGGDLAKDEGDWLCLQCGSYYYTGLYPGVAGGRNLLLRWFPESPRRRAGGGLAAQKASRARAPVPGYTSEVKSSNPTGATAGKPAFPPGSGPIET